MEVKIFWQEKCPNCPSAKELGKKLEAQGVKVTYHNVKEVDGLTTATLFGVMATPSVVVAEGDNEIASWKGEVPSIEDVKKHLER
ncbi:thioredoxin family protein [Candidatus Woesearchaeota archaeon]|nr:thioredoxin family protein [Candidatus Woesearchaeota archaeon]